MKNPFLEGDFICPNVSINKLYIAKMPVEISGEDLTNKFAQDIFSSELFIKEIKRNAENLKLDTSKIKDKELPKHLENLYDCEDALVRNTAESIVKKFGQRLGVILLTLKKGEMENRKERKDWDDIHWEYWSQLKSVILTGGLASSETGEKLRYYINEVFKISGEEGYEVILGKDAANIGIRGCATYVKNPSNEKDYLFFDFGQSFIKRSKCKFKDGVISNIVNLEKIKSSHIQWECADEEEEKREAIKLNDHIISAITKTIYSEGYNLENQIVISIANYVKNGCIYNRGGYGKLRLISDNYGEYLAKRIYEETNKKFSIKLVHDGTAMAKAFINIENAACISLGTALGVGFTESV